jgi:ketosteroid isomerase-like protein
MPDGESIRAVLERHLQSILDCDVSAYHATTVPDLTLYEWYVTPHRIDGLAFHDFLMTESARSGTPAIAPRIAPSIPEGISEGAPLDPSARAGPAGVKPRERFDLANYREQVYGDCAVCSYTLLISRATAEGTRVRSHQESRVLVRTAGQWKVAHVHKSPAWNAPYQPPA